MIQLVAMVCGSCHINQMPEDCNIADRNTHKDTGAISITSASDSEEGDMAPLYLINEDENVGL